MKRLILIAPFVLAACGASPSAEPAMPAAPSEAEPTPSVSVASEGEACGGMAKIACAEGLVCDLNEADGKSCDSQDRSGSCVTKPEMCAEFFDPVCGCDGQTYSNDCHRLMAGVARDRKGACAE